MDAISLAVLHGKHMAKCPEAGAEQKSLPLILPVVFYQGKQPWRAVGFSELLGLSKEEETRFGAYIPNVSYLFEMLQDREEKDFPPDAKCTDTVVVNAKHMGGRTPELCLHWDIKWEGVALQRLLACIEYILQDPKFDEAKVGEMLRKVRKDGAEVMRSAAERSTNEAEKKVLKKAEKKVKRWGWKKATKRAKKVGMEKGRKEIAARMLKQGTPAKTVSELTGLSPFELNQLQ